MFYKLATIFSILLFANSLALHAQIYKWVDKDGTVHFTDTPPENTKTKKVTVKINTYQSVKIIRPNDTGSDKKVATLKKPDPADKNVLMYSAEWCGVCRRAKKYFSENNIRYKDIDIDKNKQGRIAYNKLNARGVPVIFVDDIRLNGFSQKHFEQVYYR